MNVWNGCLCLNFCVGRKRVNSYSWSNGIQHVWFCTLCEQSYECFMIANCVLSTKLDAIYVLILKVTILCTSYSTKTVETIINLRSINSRDTHWLVSESIHIIIWDIFTLHFIERCDYIFYCLGSILFTYTLHGLIWKGICLFYVQF